jgi:hypothetical protein
MKNAFIHVRKKKFETVSLDPWDRLFHLCKHSKIVLHLFGLHTNLYEQPTHCLVNYFKAK